MAERSRFAVRRLAFGAIAVGVALYFFRVAKTGCKRAMLHKHNEPVALTSDWFNVGGLRMHVRVSADVPGRKGLPVILVHGWGVSSSYFIPAAKILAPHFHIWAPDLPGHGLSDTPSEPLGISGLAQALLDWMELAGINRAALVGHSMGCQIAVEAALRQPERVDRLVLIGMTTDPAARSILKQAGRLIGSAFWERVSIILPLAKDYVRMAWRLVPECRAMLSDPIEKKLKKLNLPVLLVRGEHDFIFSRRWFKEAACLLNTPHQKVISGVGHAAQYSAPQRLCDAITPFLERQRPVPANIAISPEIVCSNSSEQTGLR